jgi:hypothetical protein
VGLGDVQFFVGIALALVAAVMLLSGAAPVSSAITVLIVGLALIATSRRTPLM